MTGRKPFGLRTRAKKIRQRKPTLDHAFEIKKLVIRSNYQRSRSQCLFAAYFYRWLHESRNPHVFTTAVKRHIVGGRQNSLYTNGICWRWDNLCLCLLSTVLVTKRPTAIFQKNCLSRFKSVSPCVLTGTLSFQPVAFDRVEPLANNSDTVFVVGGLQFLRPYHLLDLKKVLSRYCGRSVCTGLSSKCTINPSTCHVTMKFFGCC